MSWGERSFFFHGAGSEDIRHLNKHCGYLILTFCIPNIIKWISYLLYKISSL